jgi:glycine/D-amino acid oxidase-like deaminating enzyme
MKTFDWIVIGNGITGAALSYELANAGAAVLLVEQSPQPQNATRYSYGGIAYWSGTTDLTRQLCQEGIDLQRSLSAELGADTQFRELDLLLTIDPDRDPQEMAATYADCMILPQVLSPAEAQAIEPLLNAAAVAGVLLLPHGHVSPEANVTAYNQAFLRLGGTIEMAQVTGLVQSGQRVQGVVAANVTYEAGNVAVCAGGQSRALLRSFGFPTRLYYTQAELIEIPPTDLRLRSIVMPAELKRPQLEANAAKAELDALWDEPNHEVAPAILDAGAIQFQDGSIRMGQFSRTFTDTTTDTTARFDAAASEAAMRNAVGNLLPDLKSLGGQWHSCLVAFSSDGLPVVGALPDAEGIHLFSGFNSPFVLAPPLARRFARHAIASNSVNPDSILAQLAPDRLRAAN